jgi:hypothetical protein
MIGKSGGSLAGKGSEGMGAIRREGVNLDALFNCYIK